MAKTQAAPPAPASEATPAADAGQEFRPVEGVTLEDVTPSSPEIAPAEAETNRGDTPHSRGMAEIVAARRRKLEAEQAENRTQGLPTEPPALGVDEHLGQPDPEAAPAPQEARKPEEVPQTAPAASPAPAPAAAAPAPAPNAEAQRVFKITVAGRQIDMPESDMIRAAELGVVSEARLREAQRMYEEAQRLRGSAPQEDPSARPSPPAATAPAPQSSPSGLDRDAALEIARELLYGDEQKVADAILRIAPRQQSQPVDPEAIARQAYERVDAGLRLRHDLETFAAEYPDLMRDADLTTLAGQYAQQLRVHYATTGSPKPELDIFREAGDRVRQKLQSWVAPAPQGQPAPAQAPAGESQRTIIKRNIPNAPAAAGAIPTQTAPRQKTASDIVNDMRRARGQPVYA